MSPKAQRAARALVAGLAGAGIIALSLWAHLVIGNFEMLAGLGYAGPGSRPVTEFGLLLDTVRFSAILVLPQALLAAFSGPWPLRALLAVLFAFGWYWVAERVAGGFASATGGGWLPGEAFAALIYRPVLTPAIWALAVLTFVFVIWRFCRRPG
ncbi:hypothetical protein [Thioclava pacifica]|uniref:Uncharacterized protein n=1 Tax=Thioclava pacifica DSM 10166 TaxID=1353537 RepID=A0A074JEU1_9RHOB|nr:hypothetical protein [Thioclava pacifica]KEO56121.1 hypothetical protein TP2_00960 [Thioclava pacifica DSM 10166]